MGTQLPVLSGSTFDAWESLIYWSRIHLRLTGIDHTFAPTKFVRANVFKIPDPEDITIIKEYIWRGLYKKEICRIRKQVIMSAITKHLKDTTMSDSPKPASPTRPPKINITCTRLDDGRKWIFGWFEVYASRRQVDFLIAERPIKWVDDNTLIIANTVKVTTDAPPTGLSEIMEHEFTERQRAWTPHAHDMRQLVAIWMEPEEERKPFYEDEPATERPKRVKAEKEPKADKPKRDPKPDGLVDLKQLLADTDIDPKEARNALRKMKEEKPAHGWSFTPAEAKSIKPRILAQVKKMRK